MKYKVLYDTIINKNHTPKDTIIEFDSGTDSGYIKRLINERVIVPLQNESKEDKSKQDEAKKEKSEERIALEERAKELGIKFQDNTKDDTLLKKIQEVESKE